MTHRNYSIKNIFYFSIAGIALLTAGIIGYNLHKKNLEETTREADELSSEMVQNGVGSK